MWYVASTVFFEWQKPLVTLRLLPGMFCKETHGQDKGTMLTRDRQFLSSVDTVAVVSRQNIRRFTDSQVRRFSRFAISNVPRYPKTVATDID